MGSAAYKSLGRVFYTAYFSTLALILLILLIGLMQGIGSPGSSGSIDLLYFFLYAVFFVTPLSVVFLGLNIWGLVINKGNRLRYILISLLLIVWCYYGIDAWIHTPLP